jgi:hypothetical protein
VLHPLWGVASSTWASSVDLRGRRRCAGGEMQGITGPPLQSLTSAASRRGASARRQRASGISVGLHHPCRRTIRFHEVLSRVHIPSSANICPVWSCPVPTAAKRRDAAIRVARLANRLVPPSPGGITVRRGIAGHPATIDHVMGERPTWVLTTTSRLQPDQGAHLILDANQDLRHPLHR